MHDPIWTFGTHPLGEKLYSYLRPLSEEYAWHAYLDAKAGDGDVLLCFFTDVIDPGDRRVLEFHADHEFRPAGGGPDMCRAVIGNAYEIEIQRIDGELIVTGVEDSDCDPR